MLSLPGHMDVNHFFVKQVLPHFDNHAYMLDQDLYEQMRSHYNYNGKQNVSYFPFPGKRSTNAISTLWIQFKKVRYVLKFIRKNNIQCVYFLSYDTLSLALYAKRFKTCRIILMNHHNIARAVRNPVKKFLFRRLSEMHHAIYAFPGAAVQLQHQLGLRNFILTDYHLNERTKPATQRAYDPRSIVVYAPSYSNDSRKIIDLLNATGNDPIIVTARVSLKVYNAYKIRFTTKLFHAYQSNDIFEQNMVNADYILLLYTDDYLYRTSGMLFDAIAYEKPVITDNRFLYEAYLEKYRLGIFVENAASVGEAISRIDSREYGQYVDAIRTYKRSYSAEKIGNDIASKIEAVVTSKLASP